jgi:probable 2-oxoglutarate dehydrogenase E1 component DHKTD1
LKIAEDSVKIPPGFTIHPRLAKSFVQARLSDLSKNAIDWATGEAMAFGSLLKDGFSVRISGQDSGRGTFSQRHVELIDQATEQKIVPLNAMELPASARLEVVNSPLSELAVMGFEYGYSMEDPAVLPLWEAQFGDFANGAQLIIDLFLATGEAKWLRQSALTLLLPHGYDGAGPEHSSGRIERFLQLVDSDAVNLSNPVNKNPNLQVINPTTPANYFHALRRQMKRNFRKPLVIFTPKTLLRHPDAISPVEHFAPSTHFLPVISDTLEE